MKIMVFDVPAETGGALTILNQYYEEAVKDAENEWIFVVSTPQLANHKNVKVLNFPWVKRSWIHRLYFDRFAAHNLVQDNSADEVLSLQNVIVPKVKVKQTLYLHQSLPFVEKRYRITENFKFWVYQNLISKMIIHSIRDADQVIVQTKWIMHAAMEKANVTIDKFVLKQPELNTKISKLYVPDNTSEKLFFYPASGFIYKNHQVIIDACKAIQNKGINNYKIIFTLNGDENKNIRRLKDTVNSENLPIEFVGSIPSEEVYEYYSKSILVFPSYIETFGLPLLEAKMHEAPIIASDCAFSHEILDDYSKVSFFKATDPNQLRDRMLDYIK